MHNPKLPNIQMVLLPVVALLSVLPSQEGSAANSMMYNDVQLTDLMIPTGQYYLADARFPACVTLLVPYQGVHYHLTEWGHGNFKSSYGCHKISKSTSFGL